MSMWTTNVRSIKHTLIDLIEFATPAVSLFTHHEGNDLDNKDSMIVWMMLVMVQWRWKVKDVYSFTFLVFRHTYTIRALIKIKNISNQHSHRNLYDKEIYSKYLDHVHAYKLNMIVCILTVSGCFCYWQYFIFSYKYHIFLSVCDL